MARLTRATTPVGSQIGASASAEIGIVHLGLGNFHRAHAAVYTALALAEEDGPWGIHGFANRSRAVVDALEAQDFRYSLHEVAAEGESAGVIDVHRALGVATAEPDAFVSSVANADRRILTLTVSERAYSLTATGELDLGAVAADVTSPDRPKTTLGLIAMALRARAATGAPFTVLSCDNLQSAGHITGSAITQFLEVSGATDDELNFVRTQVTFPNAMVDRIVPAATDTTRAAVERLLGVRDENPVTAERFRMWVIEDRFAGGRPAWHRAGATFTDEVERYEQVKLRLLNGSHSLISYLGALSDQRTIPGSFAVPEIRAAVLAAIQREYLPSIELPTAFDADDYIGSLIQRWSNHGLGDLTSRVGSDGSAKLVQRVPDPALRMLARGEVPHVLALTVASWIACLVPPAGFEPGPIATAMIDAGADTIRERTPHSANLSDHVRSVLGDGTFPDELATDEVFTERVAELLDVIVRRGALDAATDAVAAQQS